ncbi:hypothetical protein SAMN02910413_1657 [Pseudobutyrivibrio sp. C4]|nr:hypothetical protein SAMN02910413_1657 [Pseudobutyrivibrio sp. C4]
MTMTFNDDCSVNEINKKDVYNALSTMEDLNFNIHIGGVEIDQNKYLEAVTLCELMLTYIIQYNLFDVFPFIENTSPDTTDN